MQLFYEIPDTGLSKKTKKKTSAESFVDKKVVQCKHRSRKFKFFLPGWENYQLTISSRLGKLRMLLINWLEQVFYSTALVGMRLFSLLYFVSLLSQIDVLQYLVFSTW